MPDRLLLRCYGDLAELAGADRDGTVTVPIGERRAVKDVVEAVGIPHTEVDLLVVEGESVGWTRQVVGGERVAVYPPFVTLPAGVVSRVRPPRPSPLRFVADVHLGTLARRLRLLGLDTRYTTDADDAALARTSAREDRILLTRDRGLLMRSVVVHGALLRSTDPDEQLVEVATRYGLAAHARPRTRCPSCNGILATVPAAEVADRLEPGTRAAGHTTVARCRDCGRLYWPGAHTADLDSIIARVTGSAGPGG